MRNVDKAVGVVTGGARGIGAAIAARLVANGYQIAVLDVDDPMAVPPGGTFWRCDVTDAGQVDAACAEIEREMGQIDIMLCNAGIGGGAPVADLDDALFGQIIDVNLGGVFHAARAAARLMIPRGRGSIVTIGSIFGQDPPAASSAYAASKAAVAAFTRSLAREVGPNGIRVNCVSPGNIETEMYAAALQRRAKARGLSLEAMTNLEREPIALGRFGTPEDIASVVSFLVSDDARYVTGQRINVDGGLQMF